MELLLNVGCTNSENVEKVLKLLFVKYWMGGKQQFKYR